jgi:hypothetical protein
MNKHIVDVATMLAKTLSHSGLVSDDGVKISVAVPDDQPRDKVLHTLQQELVRSQVECGLGDNDTLIVGGVQFSINEKYLDDAVVALGSSPGLSTARVCEILQARNVIDRSMTVDVEDGVDGMIKLHNKNYHYPAAKVSKGRYRQKHC